ncbi:RES family NAD+ phosphorylase [Bradyrhizobium cenepequi]|uniref:RES family NAD+ phosphorylase n=1 Tax=Bradyrhizobium cenepequi TaxID=2821403 RepID=UPI001CE32FF0|nr:RES family NAD+ phosphorylase [Bradyrhizobium cenepequi]MCA6108041.1 RES family NAD+ phosphorylase [Bradyrhizobium cenepequi]
MEADESGNTTSQGEFASWRSFWDFQRQVTRGWRYVRSPEGQRFLSAVAAGCHARSAEIKEGRLFYRAQVAHQNVFDENVGEELPGPALPQRMFPFRDRATEGRVNPKGIPRLYMASDKHTAMAEVRPWIGSLVSLGLFQTRRPLRVVDCTKGAERHPIYIDGEPSAEKRAEAVWSHIAQAFREPVTRDDDVASYAATQVIAEVFRNEGFDGLAYRSAFGNDQFNIALFDLDVAELTMCSLHEIRDVELKHVETTNPYYVKQDAEGATQLVQNVIVGFRPVDPA